MGTREKRRRGEGKERSEEGNERRVSGKGLMVRVKIGENAGKRDGKRGR